MDGWFGPKLTGEDVLEARSRLQHRRDRATGSGCPRRSRAFRSDGQLFLPREADRLAADRVVLAQRVALPVVRHQDPAEVRVPLDRGCPSCPRPRARASRRSARSGRRSATGSSSSSQTWTRTRGARSAREARAGGSSSRSASASATGLRASAGRARRVQVAAPGGADVAGDAASRPSRGSRSA